MNQFRRFTGRAEGLSISFEAHLLGSKVEFDEEAGTLVIKGLCPSSLNSASSAACVGSRPGAGGKPSCVRFGSAL